MNLLQNGIIFMRINKVRSTINIFIVEVTASTEVEMEHLHFQCQGHLFMRGPGFSEAIPPPDDGQAGR